MRNKIIALTIVGAMTFSITTPVTATPLNEIIKENDSKEDDKVFKDGKYKIENDALHITEDKESMARKFLEKESSIRVKEGQQFLSITFSNKSMMKNVKVTVNETVAEIKTTNETDNTITYEFKINSIIKDKIIVSATPFPSMKVDFRLVLKEDTLEKEGDGNQESDKPDTNKPENNKPETEKPQEKPDTNKPEVEKPTNKPNNTTGSNNTQNQNKELYKMQNEILTDSEIGYGAARGAIAKTNYMEVRNGKKYITMSISGTDLMSNIRVIVNGKSINYTVLKNDKSNNLMDIEFLIGSLDDNVKFKIHIDVLGEDIDFGVKFLKDTLTQIGFLPESKPSTNLSIPNTEELLATTKSKSDDEKEAEDKKASKSNDKTSKKNTAKESYKEYTIKNEIISDSSVGRKMARKYLNKTALLEEVDGVKYITLRFSGMDLMNDIKIKVNDEDIDMELVDEDATNNVKAYRFKINNINDDIKVYAHIIPMNMDIDFGVKLLEDTLELVTEYTPEDVTIDGKKLKTTLAASFGGGMFLLGVGTSAIGTNVIRRVKVKKKEN
ncbi:NEAT domain-containing protein [Clostridium sardiniense]|uniref:NEAT domain-containing protein n=1 Tax=Clostridium sardiniense TaxID=29369 RepID=A0ABS7KTR5_CLOSR|nr:NEAT domain-containing protein [Clostridium sardiniense]MBY0754208.1 NEAT domain-containing protein [Clostridium sardiniense]MDQ0461185.1 heme-binding NEAT domain protein [Clostridium sardiniense]